MSSQLWLKVEWEKLLSPKKVYNSPDIRRNFDIHLWITVSQSFELLDIVKSIAEQLKIKPPSNLRGHHLNKLCECLNGKRYILVLDDVWSENFWTEIRNVLPDVENGSRVLTTTRSWDVAKRADPAHIPYHLQLLNHESSLKLFLKKALPQYPNEYHINNLSEISERFVKMCGGLPLALVVLGGILSNEQPTHDAWRKVLKRMNWRHVGSEVSEVLASSYDYLPFALKSCFMYFSAFREDFEIDAESLQWMWIAEGLIPQDDGSTLEDTAADFLEDLAKRSMIQVSRATSDGSITLCRIHDLMREVAMRKANDENFLTVCSNRDERSFSSARRLAVHQSNCDELLERANPNLRSLLLFECIPNCSGHRHIKVISDMRGPYAHSNAISNVGVEGLTQLRYVRFHSKVLHLENFIGRMRNLQTLELRYPHHLDLPDCFWNIKTLRHVVFPVSWTGSLGPPPKVDLKRLQTLRGIRNRESWGPGGNLPNLPNLRDLAIVVTEQLPIEVIVEFLCTLNELDRLAIKGRDFLLLDTSKFPFYANLTSLEYRGTGGSSFHGTTKFFDISLFPINLSQLALRYLELQQGHITVLEKLVRLKVLKFGSIQFVGGKMKFSTKGFPRLRELQFMQSNDVEELHIEKGAMPLLQQLRVDHCDNLELPRGLKYLTQLNSLSWYADPEKATTAVEEIRQLCKHVPTIVTEGLPQRRH
ncbi:Disease resistance protein (CC-NBS-LRR class) family [Rhynchospora pubera]|uniref:Disease resistance protein (CC-NBS-LRR class) family n=1 Tax=Rhynchospora pubera TaxID=906938 RepID=A0AAV8C4X8_9POAL|nr:Disease resistance protein (CC-NBS-LRR class) family [Rhynchospora pubera]